MSPARRVLLCLLGLQLARGLLYALLIPLWQQPDELSHVEYVELLAHREAIRLDLPFHQTTAYRVLAMLGHRGPMPGSGFTHSALRQQIAESVARHRFWELRPAADPREPFRHVELDQPPLYYLGAAQVLRWLRLGSLDGEVYALRVLNVLLTLGVVALAYQVGRAFFPERPALAVAPAAFVTFLPQYTALSASATNDKLVDLVFAALVLVVVQVMRGGFRRGAAARLLALTVAGLLTKTTAWFAVPIVLSAWAARRAERRGRSVGRYVLLRMLVLAGLAVPFFTSAERLRQLWRALLGSLGHWSPALSSVVGALGWDLAGLGGGSLTAVITYRLEFLPLRPLWLFRYSAVLFTGFWGNFGHMEAPLPLWLYGLLALASIAATLGLVLVLAGVGPPGRVPLAPNQQWVLVFCLAAVFWVALLLFARDGGVNSFSQGRHLFPVLIPAVLLFVIGLRGIAPGIDDRRLVAGLVLALALIDGLAIVTSVVPFFHGVAFGGL